MSTLRLELWRADPGGTTKWIEYQAMTTVEKTYMATTDFLAQSAMSDEFEPVHGVVGGLRGRFASLKDPRVAPASSHNNVNLNAESKVFSYVKTNSQNRPVILSPEQSHHGHALCDLDARNHSRDQGCLCLVPQDGTLFIAFSHAGFQDDRLHQMRIFNRSHFNSALAINGSVLDDCDACSTVDVHSHETPPCTFEQASSSGGQSQSITTFRSRKFAIFANDPGIKGTSLAGLGILREAGNDPYRQSQNFTKHLDLMVQTFSAFIYFSLVMTSWPLKTWSRVLRGADFKVQQRALAPGFPVRRIFKTSNSLPSVMKSPPPGDIFYPLGDPG